jgi:PPOX class probable F420-dependent enzyme
VRLRQRINRLMNRVYDRLRHPDAFSAIRSWDDGTDAAIDRLAGHTYAVLVTFRRTGEAVPSPVWFGVDGAVAYVRTFADSGKVKRIGRDPRVVLAPSTMRGKPTGPPVQAVARLLPPEEWPHAEAALTRAYGLGRRIYEGVLGEPASAVAYVELRSPEA